MNSSCNVAVLLCTYNGYRYLHAQLESIANQSFIDWKIFASDDGSSDITLSILKKFQSVHGQDRIEIYSGPCKGPTRNFLFALSKAIKSYDYFAFCDQDDVWNIAKLEIAIAALESSNNSLPALYCGATRYISSDGNFLQNSYVFKNPPTFRNALVQSIAGGNTMVFNLPAAKLFSATPEQNLLVAHDWWLYILISAHNGFIYYDPCPQVYYRQHSTALVGENRSFQSKIARIRKLLDGRFQKWNDENLRVLKTFKEMLCVENQSILLDFELMKSGSLYQRIFTFIKSGIRRQTLMGNVALMIALIVRKV
jgi:glycosyltransferase involved in cell wall biosynthesis